MSHPPNAPTLLTSMDLTSGDDDLTCQSSTDVEPQSPPPTVAPARGTSPQHRRRSSLLSSLRQRVSGFAGRCDLRRNRAPSGFAASGFGRRSSTLGKTSEGEGEGVALSAEAEAECTGGRSSFRRNSSTKSSETGLPHLRDASSSEFVFKPVDASSFQIRSENYMSSQVKVPSKVLSCLYNIYNSTTYENLHSRNRSTRAAM